jgi:hypothetical protein
MSEAIALLVEAIFASDWTFTRQEAEEYAKDLASSKSGAELIRRADREPQDAINEETE